MLDDSLRRAVLSSVREIRELKAALEEEKAKNAALQARVAHLEEQLAGRESPQRALAAEGQAGVGSPRGLAAGKKNQALMRKGLRKASHSFAEEAGAESVLTYGAAVAVLRLLERSEAGRLGQTCRAWHAHCRQYLGEWRRTRLALELGDTERTYLQNMRGIVERYILPRAVGTKFLDDAEAFDRSAFDERRGLGLLHRRGGIEIQIELAGLQSLRRELCDIGGAV